MGGYSVPFKSDLVHRTVESIDHCLISRNRINQPSIETYYEDGQWKSRRQNSDRAFSAGGTKSEQQAKGREAAQKDGVEHIIKKQDGTIGERNSYGNDPNPPKG